MIGWIIAAGVVFAVAALKYFWEDIAAWLNNTAADAVEKALGYDAKKFMQRAVSRVTKGMRMLDNVTTVFTKKHATDTLLHKVTLRASAPIYEQDADVLKELERSKELVNTFTYGDGNSSL